MSPKEQVGQDQLLNENQFHYLVQIVSESVGDTGLFPTLAEEAAAYAHHIITRHRFLDRNKRTGMHCALLFLELNGFCHPWDIDDSIIELGLNIANGTIDDIELIADHLQSWLEPHTNETNADGGNLIRVMLVDPIKQYDQAEQIAKAIEDPIVSAIEIL